MTASLTGLTPDTTYYYRVVATNAGGTDQRHDPQLHHAPPVRPPERRRRHGVHTTTATLNASVNPEGTPTTVTFVFGTDPNLATGTTTTTAQAIGSGAST